MCTEQDLKVQTRIVSRHRKRSTRVKMVNFRTTSVRRVIDFQLTARDAGVLAESGSTRLFQKRAARTCGRVFVACRQQCVFGRRR